MKEQEGRKSSANNEQCGTNNNQNRKPTLGFQIFSGDRLIDSFFAPTSAKLNSFKPATDVIENEKEFKVFCNVPGLREENLKIEIDEEVRVLNVSGRIENEKKEENEKLHIREREYGTFMRSIYLPRLANMEEIKAQLENGVLRISIPKSEEKKRVRSIRLSNL